MRWNFRRSMELKKVITTNRELMQELSKTVEILLKDHKIDLTNKSYVFEPRVFNYTQKEIPEISAKARRMLFKSLLDDRVAGGIIIDGAVARVAAEWHDYIHKCIPECGGLDAKFLEKLDFLRVRDYVSDDPLPLIDSYDLIKRMIGNQELMVQFSQNVFGLLERNGFKLNENEGCVFTPHVFDTPVYAQKVGIARQTSKLRGFGPQIIANSNPLPAHSSKYVRLRVQPFPGIIDGPWGPTPGIIIDRWWWIGIPAPDLLIALDKMRNL